MESETKNTEYSYGLLNHWINFTIGLSAYVLMIVLAMFLNPFQFPLLSIAIAFALFAIMRINRNRDNTSCMLVAYVLARTLAQYTVIIIAIYVVYYYTGNESILATPKGGYSDFIDFPVLLLSPMLMINTIIVSLKKNKCTFCALCLLRTGAPSERGVAGRIHSHETIKLVREVCIMNVILSIATWTYFIFVYNNANITDFDNLIFVGVPVVLWILHEISVAIRSWVLTGYCARRNRLGGLFVKDSTMLRYLVVCDNKLYVSFNGDASKKKARMDTPISSYIPFQVQVSAQLALSTLKTLIGVDNGFMKFLYSFVDEKNNCSVNNYIYFMDSIEEINNIKGEWIPFREIEVAFTNNELEGALKTQLHRLYTAILAYKTYNPDGSHKFRIKSYRPSFNLDDIRNIDIDYVDPNVMLLSVGNADARFYKLRQWWYKYIEGLID